MKNITIICDICRIQCELDNFSIFVFPKMIVDDQRNLGKVMAEQHFCRNCFDKITRFIEELSLERKQEKSEIKI